ncbi:MAG: hypothetical protein NT016_02400 [Candidatus Aenigmarchaeota archaeon]|nr:hypothetical protein [Candidatus Aenigmarchaeota archaeon]
MAKVCGRKGIINVIELSLVVVTLFVSFSVFFPGNSYKDKWDDAYGTLKARDAALTLERTGNLHAYAYDSGQMDAFLTKLFTGSNAVVWHSISGGIAETTKVACNCTSIQVAQMNGWAGRTLLNKRNISMEFCRANLVASDECLANSDVLLIWGSVQPLGASSAALIDYVSKGGGIVELKDFSQSSQVESDSVQTGIFGLRWGSLTTGQPTRTEFSRTPRGESDIIYQPYKYFHHIPIMLNISKNGGAVTGCTYNPTGNGTLTLKGVSYEFDTCSPVSAWIDTDGTGGGDTMVSARQTVSVGGSSLLMSYVNGFNSISLSFQPGYQFGDILSFTSGSRVSPLIQPRDGNNDRVLLQSVFASSATQPAAIIGSYGSGKTAWLPEFGKDSLDDSEKSLVMSMLLWAANKESASPSAQIANVGTGYVASYINVQNYDMFELYELNIGVGYPI